MNVTNSVGDKAQHLRNISLVALLTTLTTALTVFAAAAAAFMLLISFERLQKL